MTQVPINPPPWGPARDPHFDAKLMYEGYGLHTQANASQAALRGWYYRPDWFSYLVPDTRRCLIHGEIMYPAFELTSEERDTYYTAQKAGYATGYANTGMRG